jgi:hypothetical protein
MILVIMTIFMAWFSAHMDMSMQMGPTQIDYDGDFDLGLSSGTGTIKAMGMEMTYTYTYDEVAAQLSGGMGTIAPGVDPAVDQINSVLDTFGMAYIFVILGMILSILALILILVAGLSGKIPGSIGGICGVIGAIFMLIAPLYLVFAFPNAVNEIIAPAGEQISFWGTYSYAFMGINLNLSWGAGMGWYLAVVAFVILLIGSIMAFGIKKPQPAPAYAPMLQPQPQQPQMQQQYQQPYQPPQG